MAETRIEWADVVWNPLAGCSRVSAGCRNCYAERLAARLALMGQQKYQGLTTSGQGGPRWTGEVRLDEASLALPLGWKKPRRIFVNSMSDPFHQAVRDEDLDRLFAVMALARQHTFILLTKRPSRMQAYLAGPPERAGAAPGMGRWWYIFAKALRRRQGIDDRHGYGPVYPEDNRAAASWWPGLPLPNVWLGFSAEDQAAMNERWPHAEPLAAQGWRVICSAEPLIGPVDPTRIEVDAGTYDALAGTIAVDGRGHAPAGKLSWLITGGESGGGARPVHPEWVRGLRDGCASAATPFFFKQWGEWGPGARCDRPNVTTHRFDDGTLVSRFGKKSAGSQLDGREHRAVPA